MSKSRDRRELQAGSFYHIFNRGNRRENIYKEDSDLNKYKDLLFSSFKKHDEELVAYCLMHNHFHLIIKIREVKRFVKAMSLFQSMCAIHYNKKYITVGHVFQDKYKHRLVTSIGDLISLTKYVHMNPFEEDNGNSMKELLSYKWFSLRTYIDLEENEQISKHYVLDHFEDSSAYYSFLTSKNIIQQAACVKSKAFEEYLNEEFSLSRGGRTKGR